ncbi:unnamed protein product [Blepharisma stoltei]|uniref:Tyrosine-protein kinase ephrin type A/B receptor-like domain-containing protein n=1 Tax=Blepharisma stoltei TaxID=1481888 RepID=A0AAU9J8X6_9CILI|nr:unnamed protein product [Blepharisma stoltei]
MKGDIPSPRTLSAFTKYRENGNLKFVIYGGVGLNGDESNLAILDVNSMKWSLMPANGDAPDRISAASLEYYNGMLYLVGGVDDSIPVDLKYNSDFYQYDLIKNIWAKISNPRFIYTHRSFAGSAVYDGYFYFFFGWSDKSGKEIFETSMVNLNDPNFQWLNITLGDKASTNALYRDSYSFASVNSSFFIFAGYSMASGNLNDLIKFNLSDKEITYTYLSKPYTGPSARSHHSMQIMEANIYIFGGDKSGFKLNDLWRFDIETENWAFLYPSGDIPPARSHHSAGAQGNAMYIFGGISESGSFLNDLYQYDVTSNLWKHIEPSSLNTPSARYSSCIVYSIPILYIFGGMTSTGVSNELWTYDCGSNKFTLISKKAPYSIYYPRCAVDTSGSIFYVLNGQGERDAPMSYIFSFNLSSAEWKVLKEPDIFDRNKADGIAVYIEDFVIYIGGQQWGTDPKSSAYAIDLLNNFQYYDYPLSPMHFIGSAFAYYKTDIYVHGGVASTDLIIRNLIPVINFYKISLTQFCNHNSCPAICSPGTYIAKNSCKPCERGTYNHKFGQAACNDCDLGTYNPNIGSNSVRECFPCKAGEFSDLRGQYRCKLCPLYHYCPTGSSKPSDIPSSTMYSSLQPRSYTGNSGEVSALNTYYLYSSIGFFIIVTISIIISKDLRNELRKIDSYSENHNLELEAVMRKSKNRFGGYFTIGFIVGALWLIYANIVTYILDNAVETKTLLPLAAVWDETKSYRGDITLVLTLLRYGGNCTNNGACVESLYTTSNQVVSSSVNQSCYMDPNDNCIVTFFCKNCEFSTGAEINVLLQESLSFCSGILVNLTSTSSIPNEISSEKIGVMSDQNKIFRGYSPTTFYFTMTPSLFKSSVSSWPSKSTGYHVEILSSPSKGSQHYAYELPFSSDLNVKIVIEKNNDCLSTTRNAKHTLLILLSAVLGAVFGWKGTMQGIMQTIERRIWYARTKISKAVQISNSIASSKNLANIFNSEIINKDEICCSVEENDKNYLLGRKKTCYPE